MSSDDDVERDPRRKRARSATATTTSAEGLHDDAAGVVKSAEDSHLLRPCDVKSAEDSHLLRPSDVGGGVASGSSSTSLILQELLASSGDPRRNGREKRQRSASSDNGDAVSNRVFVGGLDHTCGEEALRKHFSSFGVITEVKVMVNKTTGASRGFGFVTFKDAEGADRAMKNRMQTIGAKSVEVKPAVKQVDGATGSRFVQPKTISLPPELASRKAFIGGLPKDASEINLREYFQRFGAVAEVQIMRDHTTNRSRGFGFVTFQTPEGLAACSPDRRAKYEFLGKIVEVKRLFAKDFDNSASHLWRKPLPLHLPHLCAALPQAPAPKKTSAAIGATALPRQLAKDAAAKLGGAPTMLTGAPPVGSVPVLAGSMISPPNMLDAVAPAVHGLSSANNAAAASAAAAVVAAGGGAAAAAAAAAAVRAASSASSMGNQAAAAAAASRRAAAMAAAQRAHWEGGAARAAHAAQAAHAYRSAAVAAAAGYNGMMYQGAGNPAFGGSPPGIQHPSAWAGQYSALATSHYGSGYNAPQHNAYYGAMQHEAYNNPYTAYSWPGANGAAVTAVAQGTSDSATAAAAAAAAAAAGYGKAPTSGAGYTAKSRYHPY